MESPELLDLLENKVFDEASAPMLEGLVSSQLAQQSYSFAVNKAMLKNYQVNRELIKPEVVCNVLILALMRLPSTDFLALAYMIPIQTSKDPNVLLILKCADLLERGKFLGFWEEYISAPQSLFEHAIGLVDAVRLYILGNIRDTFKSIPKQIFQQQLGLNDSSIFTYCESNKYVEKIEGDDVILTSNAENQNQRGTLAGKIQAEEGMRAIENLIITTRQ